MQLSLLCATEVRVNSWIFFVDAASNQGLVEHASWKHDRGSCKPEFTHCWKHQDWNKLFWNMSRTYHVVSSERNGALLSTDKVNVAFCEQRCVKSVEAFPCPAQIINVV